MFWITRPQYLRWIAALLVVGVTLWIELRPPSTTLHPFLIYDVARGETVEGALEWQSITAGVITPVAGRGYTTHLLVAGEPLQASDTTTALFSPPDGWWVVDLELPRDSEVGSPIQLVILSDPGTPPRAPIPGYVTRLADLDAGFGSARSAGSAAFTPEYAATAAVAIADAAFRC